MNPLINLGTGCSVAGVGISLAQVAGRNARRLRQDAGVTLEQLATAARPYGLRWSSGRVGDFEGGRISPTLPTLFAVTLALRDATGQPVALGDLFAGADDVALNDSVTVPLATLRSALSGNAVGPDVEVRVIQGSPSETLVVVDPLPGLSESDWRLLRDIDVEPRAALAAMAELWGRSLSAERDARAGAGANAQAKGQITRKLIGELRIAMVDELMNEVNALVGSERDEQTSTADSQATSKGAERGNSK